MQKMNEYGSFSLSVLSITLYTSESVLEAVYGCLIRHVFMIVFILSVCSEPGLSVLASVQEDKPGTEHPAIQFYTMLFTMALTFMTSQVRVLPILPILSYSL